MLEMVLEKGLGARIQRPYALRGHHLARYAVSFGTCSSGLWSFYLNL